ncbi:DUF948 domain-containing protein [Thalassobacillus devorans]|uniref:DUF948 domain-containing protein n=1 Tax=Thalassobacillus devorans TaxID=279813 RepID=UPI00048E96A9|nr:DUF948 domain-containing protein [Thalassobacillus devorans]
MELVYIGIFIMALSFALVVAFIVKTLVSVNKSMKSLDGTVDNLVTQMNGITKESEHLINKSNYLAEDINHKIDSTNGLFESLQNVGDSVDNLNHGLNKATDNFTYHTNKHNDKIIKAVRWGEAITNTYAKWKRSDKSGDRHQYNH